MTTTFLRSRRSDVRSTAPWTPFAYVGRKLREAVADLVTAAAPSPGAVVVDFGCADRPYRGVLPQHVDYVGADLEGNDVADVLIRSDGTVDVADQTCDL